MTHLVPQAAHDAAADARDARVADVILEVMPDPYRHLNSYHPLAYNAAEIWCRAFIRASFLDRMHLLPLPCLGFFSALQVR